MDTPSQDKIVDFISKHPGCSFPEILNGAAVSRGTINSALRRLLKHGELGRTGSVKRYRYRLKAVNGVNGAPPVVPAASVPEPTIVSELDAAIAALEVRIEALQEAVRILKGLKVPR